MGEIKIDETHLRELDQNQTTSIFLRYFFTCDVARSHHSILDRMDAT